MTQPFWNCLKPPTHETSVCSRVIERTPNQIHLDTICKKYRSTKLRFLILLPESDYNKWFFSYKDLLYYRRHHFPGKLIIEKYEEIDELPYNIEEPVMPRQVYIMLPKERIYIPSNQFTHRYIRSKMRELVQIFVALRAKNISYTHYDSSEERQSFGTDINLAITSTAPSPFDGRNSFHNEHSDIHQKGTQYEIRLQPTDSTIDISVFEDTKRFYYLRREPSWRDMILRRIDGGVVYDKYTYWNKEIEIFNSHFLQRFKCFQLNIDYDWSKFTDFRMDYEVTY